MAVFVEVRSDYYNPDLNAYAIDAWQTDDDDEEGQTVAYVYPNGKVEYCHPDAETSLLVQEEINQLLDDLKS